MTRKGYFSVRIAGEWGCWAAATILAYQACPLSGVIYVKTQQIWAVTRTRGKVTTLGYKPFTMYHATARMTTMATVPST